MNQTFFLFSTIPFLFRALFTNNMSVGSFQSVGGLLKKHVQVLVKMKNTSIISKLPGRVNHTSMPIRHLMVTVGLHVEQLWPRKYSCTSVMLPLSKWYQATIILTDIDRLFPDSTEETKLLEASSLIPMRSPGTSKLQPPKQWLLNLSAHAYGVALKPNF